VASRGARSSSAFARRGGVVHKKEDTYHAVNRKKVPMRTISKVVRAADLGSCWCLIAAVFVGPGCAFPSLPPPMSAAKFVRPSASTEGEGADSAGGKVAASTGLFIHHEDEQTNVFTFPGEGALSLWLAPNYDVAITAGNFLASAEGNFVVLEAPLRLGVLHGLGFSIFDNSGGTDEPRETTLFLDLTVGAFAQFPVPDAGDLFGALKYTYATNAEDEDRDVLRSTHYVTGSAGYMLRLGGLLVSPELIVSLGSWVPQDNADRETFWMAILAGTVGAAY